MTAARIKNAQCDFNLNRLDRHLEAKARTIISKTKTKVMKVDERSKAYLGGVLESITFAIIQNAVYVSEKNKKSTILPKNIMHGIRVDADLSVLASGSSTFIGSYLNPKKVDEYVRAPVAKKKK